MTDKLLGYIVSGVLLVGGFAYIVVMQSYPGRAGTVPSVVASIMIVSVAFDLVKDVWFDRRRFPAGGDGDDAHAEEEARLFVDNLRGRSGRRLALIAGWTVGLLVLLRAIGFALGSGIGLFIFLRINGTTVGRALIGSLVLGAGSFLVMEVLLGVPALEGFLVQW